MSRAVKTKGFDGKQLVKRDEMASLRGTVVVLNVEKSEIAKRLEITEEGYFGMRFK